LVGGRIADYTALAVDRQLDRPLPGKKERMTQTEPSTAPVDIGGRARILREARALFTAHGYAAVSMQQIADAATVNKATLYHHFQDKDDLFVSVMAEEFARTSARIEAAIASGGSLRDQLRRVAETIFAARQSDFGRLAADLRERVGEHHRAVMMTRCTPPWEQIRDAIARAREIGEVRDVDPDLMARLFFAMVGSQIWWSKFEIGQQEPDDRLAATIADVLLDGIGSDQTASGESEAHSSPSVED
jgi:AcrR family transcriptional regulator